MAEDKNLTCRDCGKTFVFTAGEQAFFAEKGLSDPIRCPDCRRLRKQQRADSGPAPAQEGARSSGPRPGGAGRPEGAERSGGSGFRPGGTAVREVDMPPRAPRGEDDESAGRAFRNKAKPPASVTAKFGPPKKEQVAVPKEKRPNNRRDEEKLLLNWKEEVGLDDEANEDWLSYADGEEE